MISTKRKVFLFSFMGLALVCVGLLQSWNVALAIFNMCIISAIMTLGVNIQWGYAGLFNAGIMGFTIIGGLAAVLVSIPPVEATWAVGGTNILLGLIILITTILIAITVWKKTKSLERYRYLPTILIIIIGYALIRITTGPAIEAIENTEAAKTGYLGGLGLPILLSWIVGGVFAAGVAWVIGKITLELRSDYLAIATLGISGIILYIVKNEDWLTRGVKNVNGIPRPVPYEINLQNELWFQNLATFINVPVRDFSTIFVKCCYSALFLTVLFFFVWLSEKALRSPWGRMMRAIRDNEIAARAMGKNVSKRHLQVFVLGSAMIGVAGAMMTTLEGQFTPMSFTPLRYTFVIWVMVIVGGSGNNLGSILGGFLIWFFWVESEPIGIWLISSTTGILADNHPVRVHLIESVAHMRYMTMGIILLLVLRFAPKGLIPEEKL
ncbi:MAG: branched-chain amino acid ABC transporter permease [Paracoccaceae bacterium]|nr:branched-chain amino acid ABC transporter permease [Paracoccaceae bacterium]